MKAAAYTRYGSPDVVQIMDVEKPVPKDNEVLIKVRAASVNPADWRLMGSAPYVFRVLFRLRKPTPAEPGRLGHDVAGQVEVVGRNVTRFKPADSVFGTCRGALAEYACASESALIGKPEKLTFEEAASVPVAALTALQGLRDKGRIQPGHKVLINGAGGGVGTFAVQIARSLGAEVTAVCSTRNLEIARSIGADHVVDYTQEDFTRANRRYDVILDNIGNHSPVACRRCLTRHGTYVAVGASSGVGLLRMLAAPLLSRFVGQRFTMVRARPSATDLATLGGMIASGAITPVIDRRYALADTAAAMAYMEQGHVRGKIIVSLDDASTVARR